jgi:hypothetical protein
MGMARAARMRDRRARDSTFICLNPGRFVLKPLKSGVLSGQAQQFCLLRGQLPVTERQFYTTQTGMLPGILAFAREIVDANKDAMSPGTWLGIARSWNHHRNASEYIVELIGCQNGTMVDFGIVSRDTRFAPGITQERPIAWRVSVSRECQSGGRQRRELRESLAARTRRRRQLSKRVSGK